MAKKKAVEEIIENDVKLAENEEIKAEKPKKEVAKDERKAFIERKLKAINSMQDKAKAKKAFERLMSVNKRGK